MDDTIKKLFEVNVDQLPSSIPLFPLDNVLLLPFGKLPLNIFEERYIKMALDSLKNHKSLKLTLNKAIKSNKAEFIEVILKPDQKIIPKLQFGNPIEDLSPLLPRKEFAKNMFIDTTKRSKKIFEAN